MLQGAQLTREVPRHTNKLPLTTVVLPPEMDRANALRKDVDTIHKVREMQTIRVVGLIIFLGLQPTLLDALPRSSVGFEEVHVSNGSEPPLSAGIWYPTDALATEHALELFTRTVALDASVAGRSLPLVVISHGGGGSYASH
jgi:hypothetical protein